MCQMPYSSIKILVLINVLSVGRYFSYTFIPTFAVQIQEVLEIEYRQVMELLEWYQWPNMILSFICGFLMDHLLGMKVSMFTFGLIAMFGHIFFVTSFYVRSFWLCASSQLLLGLGYETIFIIQLSYCGRNFIYGRIYTVVGTLFGTCFITIFFGKMILPLLFRGLGENLVTVTALLFIPHLLSFVSAMWLIFFSALDGSNPSESYVLRKHFRMNMFVIVGVLIFYYSPNLQFWAESKESLIWKYGKSGQDTAYLFFASTSLSMPLFGHFLDRTGPKLVHLLWGLVILFLAHSLLAFSFVSPWLIVFFVGIAHAISQLIIWVFVLSIVPKHEYGTAMGFLQSFENLTFAMCGHLKPIIMDSIGLLLQGIVNILCIIIAYCGAFLLWYTN